MHKNTTFGTAWEKLNSLKRYSNVSSSDYMYTINRLLEKGTSPETIAEFEHIRWCDTTIYTIYPDFFIKK